MELANFEFKKERKLGEFVQDFINLLKIIFSHMLSVMFRILVLPICAMLLLSYYISTQLNSSFSIAGEEFFFLFFVAVLLILFIGLFTCGFTIEYFILIRDRKNTDFGVRDVWNGFKTNIGKYFKFLLGAIIVGLLMIIPVIILTALTVFIPMVGSLFVGVIFAIVGLYFFSSFMLYREGYDRMIKSYSAGFVLIKGKLLQYGIASYVVSFIFQSLLYLMTLLPVIVIGIITYNTVGFTSEFFDTYFGKMMMSIGGTLLTLFAIIYYMLAIISYGIIYETAKEMRFGESIFMKISKIGRSEDV